MQAVGSHSVVCGAFSVGWCIGKGSLSFLCQANGLAVDQSGGTAQTNGNAAPRRNVVGSRALQQHSG
jgi:hypothetical protein